MNKILLLISFSLISNILFSQDYNTKIYNWEEDTKISTVAYDTSSHAVYLVKKMVKELVYEDNTLIEYYLVHHRVKLLTNQAVLDFNTAYIPQFLNSETITEKARFIKKNGNTIDLKQSEIKTGKDESTNREYRYFAFEGVEIGGEIEYLYLIKKAPYHYGQYFKVQNAYPIFNYSFDFYAPHNLDYKFKSYNQLPEIRLDTSYKTSNYWHVEMDSITKFKKERVSNHENNLMAFGYKLNKNYSMGSNDITSYGPWARDAYSNIYKEDKKQINLIKKIIKEIKIDKSNNENTIRTIEDFLKKNYTYFDESLPELSNITNIYKNKAFNKTGALFIYTNILKALDIKHEIIVLSNRWDIRFDKDFESYIYLNDYLINVPSIDKILSPYDIYSRLGFPPQEFTHTYGLFIKEVSLGDFYSGVGKIKFIPAVSMEKTLNDLNINISFTEDLGNAVLKTKQKLTGYDAAYYQTVFEHIDDEEQLTKFESQIVNIFGIDEEPLSSNFINTKGSDFGINPLIIESEFHTDKLSEKAGETYLFKVGQLIGPQMELYNAEESRQGELEFYYNRKYHRQISIDIPENFELNNLAALNFNEEFKDEKDKTVFAFIASHQVKDNKLVITIDEWYDGIVYSKEIWDEYRRVVNAAANFNKVNIFFKKIDLN